MDLIRSNKKGLRHGRFCSFQCFKIWSDCLNFKHWPILPSASGSLLIFTVKSTLSYTRVLRQSTKKKKKSIIPRSDVVVCDIWSGCTRFGNSFIESGTDKPCWSKQKRKGRKRCVQAVHSFTTLSKATFDLLDMPTAPGCFAVSMYSHVSHKRIDYQTSVTDDSC